jgi:hypothetical protein
MMRSGDDLPWQFEPPPGSPDFPFQCFFCVSGELFW